MTNKETIQDLRDKVADVKWDLQRVLDILDTLYHEDDEQYLEQTGREQALALMNESLKREVELYTQKYNELVQKKDVPTMPVIPKDVAIAIFREGERTSGSLIASRKLKGLCEREGFECRIHGIDDNPTT